MSKLKFRYLRNRWCTSRHLPDAPPFRVGVMLLLLGLTGCAMGLSASERLPLGEVLLPVRGSFPPVDVPGISGPVAMPLDAQEGRSEADEVAARQAEVERAKAQVWAIASGVQEVGARLHLLYWVENGAFTRVGYHAEGRGGRGGQPVQERAFARVIEHAFGTFSRQHVGMVRMVLLREEGRWELEDFKGEPGHARPAEARRLPVRSEGVPSATFLGVVEAATRMMKPVQVPRGGQARYVAELKMEDGRVVDVDTRVLQETRAGGSAVKPGRHDTGEVTHALLALTEGIGLRTVRVEVVAAHSGTEATARTWVERVEVVRAPRLEGEDEDFAAAYHATHEATLRRWREELADGTAWVLRRGAEEMALWYVGGILNRGVGLMAEAAAPLVKTALGRGGAVATGWLRTTLKRMPPAQRKQFEQLWMKLFLEGEAALSPAERQTLVRLMERLDLIIRKPLNDEEKTLLRGAARRYFQRFSSKLDEAMCMAGPYEVHHRRPLEYAHLFADEDINNPQNLRAVGTQVHQHISKVWTEFRKTRGQASPKDVEAVVSIIDECFSGWYDQPYVAGSATAALEAAMKAAMQKVAALP